MGPGEFDCGGGGGGGLPERLRVCVCVGGVLFFHSHVLWPDKNLKRSGAVPGCVRGRCVGSSCIVCVCVVGGGGVQAWQRVEESWSQYLLCQCHWGCLSCGAPCGAQFG